MIQMQTLLNVADNSGAKRVMCIKVLGGGDSAGIGDVIRVSIKEATPNGRVKRGTTHLALIVRTVKGVRRADGSRIRFDDNAVVLLNPKKELVGTRVSGAVTRELRDGFMRVISLAEEVL